MMANNMFFDAWYEKLPEEEKQNHEYDCPVCGYELILKSTENKSIGIYNLMYCQSCGYEETWFECKNELNII